MQEPPGERREPGETDEPYQGRGSLARLQASMIRSADLMIFLAVDQAARIAYASRGARHVLGHAPEDMLGRSVIDYLHPDDVERATMGMSWRDDAGNVAPAPARFRALTADGTYTEVEAFPALVEDGAAQYMGLYVLGTYAEIAADTVLRHLLHGATRTEALTPVLNSISWREYGSGIGISWREEGAFAHVSNGLPGSIAGAADGDGGPWTSCRRAQIPVRGRADADTFDGATLAVLDSLGFRDFWVEPVVWDDEEPPATITIWTTGSLSEPAIHASGMEIAKNLTELILRWTAQAKRLEELATRDGLTGLVNRRVFFEMLEHAGGHGAILYCDLDHFKPVNDEMGHATGDRVLQVVARRMAAAVRSEDVVGRLGGDEFAVLCVGATAEVAREIAGRILRSLAAPIEVDGKLVTVGVTIGVAHSTEPLSEKMLEVADRALRDAKAAGRSAIRLAVG